GPGPRRDHLRLSEPRALPYISLGSVRGLAFFGLAEPLPLFVAPVMSRVDPSQRARSAARDEGFGLGPVHVVLDALQDFAIGHPGGGEEDIVATDEVIDAKHAVELRTRGFRLLFLFGLAGVEPALDLAAHAFQ